MRDRFDELCRHAADVGITVDWGHLRDKRRGEYRLAGDRIILSPRLTQVQALSVLVHELGHWRFGDRCSTPANEQRAWQYGAAMLISPAQYEAAESMVGHHISALALELGVTPRVRSSVRF